MKPRAQHSRIKAALVVLIFAAGLFPAAAAAQNSTPPPISAGQQEQAGTTLPRGKKLIMKDGSFQIVSSYQVQGDRVRYYSVERSEWEEVPAAMVDWDATKKAAAQASAQESAMVSRLKKEEAEATAASIDVDASIEVLPGKFLPPGQGMFVLENHAILPMTPSQAATKLDKKRLLERIMIPIAIMPSQRDVILDGAHAKFRLTDPNSEFYLRATDIAEPNVELIQAKVKGDHRRVEDILTNVVRQQREDRKSIALQTWQVAKGVYRFTLSQPLKPGEYALAEYLPGEGINLYLWDFGVDSADSKK